MIGNNNNINFNQEYGWLKPILSLGLLFLGNGASFRWAFLMLLRFCGPLPFGVTVEVIILSLLS